MSLLRAKPETIALAHSQSGRWEKSRPDIFLETCFAPLRLLGLCDTCRRQHIITPERMTQINIGACSIKCHSWISTSLRVKQCSIVLPSFTIPPLNALNIIEPKPFIAFQTLARVPTLRWHWPSAPERLMAKLPHCSRAIAATAAMAMDRRSAWWPSRPMWHRHWRP